MITNGQDLENLGQPVYTRFADGLGILRWIEGVYRAPDGVIWGLYHREDYKEPGQECPGRPYFTVPTIGIAKSLDGGFHWIDLGLVLKDFGIDDACDASINEFFAGGVGDPSWAIDESTGYAYIFYSSYSGTNPENHGIQIARIALANLGQPVGNVWRWDGRGFREPGLGGIGRVVLEASVSWHAPGSDAFWGPSIHWNTYLGMHVVLLNRTQGPDFAQEGAYVMYVPRLDDPSTWTQPRKFMDGGRWYMQIVGDPHERGTDSLAGQSARLFMHGTSEWRIWFERH
jgi:hypothetical protein